MGRQIITNQKKLPKQDSYVLTEITGFIEPGLDALLALAENEQLYLYVYAADYLVLWEREEEYERIKKKYILCPRYAEALRTNPTKNIKYIGKLVDGNLITGTLFWPQSTGEHIKCGPDISINNVLILKDQIDEITSGKYIESISLKSSPNENKEKIGGTFNKESLDQLSDTKCKNLWKVCKSLDKAVKIIGGYNLTKYPPPIVPYPESPILVAKCIVDQVSLLLKLKPNKFGKKGSDKLEMLNRNQLAKYLTDGDDHTEQFSTLGISTLYEYFDIALGIED